MKNPFIYSGIVEGESFCNRKRELNDLVKFSEASQNVMIYSHRRFGKTSLIKQVIRELGKRRPPIKTFYIDLYGTLTEKDLITSIVRSFSQVETKIEKLASVLKKLFTNTRPKISFDPETGKMDITPYYDPEERQLVFTEVLESLAKYSEKSKSVVIFDEFQEIAAYDDKTVEKRLRKVIQFHKHIGYFFVGSQRHILDQMFSDSSRALYKLAEPYPLKKIETVHYMSWLKGLFHKYKRQEPPDRITRKILLRCENHPLYVQQFFFFLWNEDEITEDTIGKVENLILQRRHNEYANRWDNLSLNQKKTCVLLINSGGKSIYQTEGIQKAGLKSPSQVKMAVEYLQRNDIISKNDIYHFNDTMFKKWINRLASR